jgi:aryl-alcohol dehydrogenase-like predicted oxidoreductase
MQASAPAWLRGAAGARWSTRFAAVALSAAFDAGITFYDTARSYGYGESEALLVSFAHAETRQ